MNNRFLAMTKMCLNNWHYINKRVIHYHEIVNFFTGHSGSGKSTVIDALQMIYYADTTGRGFFNKAAKEDSNRTLIEYLRGMIQIEENNKIKYLRNKNFSSTVVLEFQDTETKSMQCIGVAFDVDTNNNHIIKQWFWHTGALLENNYQNGDNKTLTIGELKDYLKRNFSQDEYFLTTTDVRFRNEIYNNYFGGLSEERFIALFKKAIPFKMDMKLDDFIKNYIFTQVNIRIDDMKDSVAQYSNLKLKLEDTKGEIELLLAVQRQYQKYAQCCDKELQFQYNQDCFEIKLIHQNIQYNQAQLETLNNDVKSLKETSETLLQQIKEMQIQRDEVAGFIQNSGYAHLKEQLKLLTQNIDMLGRSKSKYDRLASKLRAWIQTELLEQDTVKAMEAFEGYHSEAFAMESIRDNIKVVKEALEEERRELDKQIHILREQIKGTKLEIEGLKNGHKNYSYTLLEVKEKLSNQLTQYYGEPIQVEVLADVIDVEDDAWLNAIEGYMGGNKTALIVPPCYSKKAMEFYRELDKKKYHHVAVVDTEKVLTNAKPPMKNSLAEEVRTTCEYVRAYIDYLLGRVIKCNTIDEVREHHSSVTKDCVLYQGFKLQHIDPKNYTDFAYIGQGAIAKRLGVAMETLKQLDAQTTPMDDRVREINGIISLESFQQIEDYVEWSKDIEALLAKESERHDCQNKIEELMKTDIESWQKKLVMLEKSLEEARQRKSQADSYALSKTNKHKEISELLINYHAELIEKQKLFVREEIKEKEYTSFMAENEGKRADFIKLRIQNELEDTKNKKEKEYSLLIEKRQAHYEIYSYRGFSVPSKDNEEYDKLLNILSSEKLVEFTQKASRQAQIAVKHFKSDFVYKIRAAILDAQKQKNELNQVLERLDFGKDKYSFSVTKNTGEEGKFYEMFMNKDLEINPKQLDHNIDGQVDLFSMSHEHEYNEIMNELLEMFMPPANSDAKTLETARANVERYSDYRTYLSFDMNQRVNGGPPTSLAKMLSKNSGGEGQNPLYVALLASFAQVYRINVNSKIKRRPTPRLVILDEAFSKMDAEKVSTCIALINSLHVQAIISAPNDKIQNYTESVDKLFLFANQNKTRISIEEFEQDRFYELMESLEEDEDNRE